MQANGLALEYQRDYTAARGDLNVFDLVNEPCASGKCSVFGLSFAKKRSDSFVIQARPFRNDAADSLVVAEDTGETLL